MEDPDDLAVRRMLFAVLCSVVVLIGGVFMYQSLSQNGAGGQSTIMAAEGHYTIRLRIVPEQQAEQWQEVARRVLESQGVSARVFAVPVEDGDGQLALCVGRFMEPDSESTAEVLKQVSRWTTQAGNQPFADARVMETE